VQVTRVKQQISICCDRKRRLSSKWVTFLRDTLRIAVISVTTNLYLPFYASD